MSSHCAGDDPWACLKLKILLGRTLLYTQKEVGVSHDKIKQACNMGLVTVYNYIYIYAHVDIQYTWTFVPIFHTHVSCISNQHARIHYTFNIYIYIYCIKKHTFFQGQGPFSDDFPNGFLGLPPLTKGTIPPVRTSKMKPDIRLGETRGGKFPRPQKSKGFMDFSPTLPIFSGTYPPWT